MPLFGTRRQSTPVNTEGDLEAFKQRVVEQANAVARRYGQPSAAQEFLRSLDLAGAPVAQAAPAPVTKTIGAEVDAEVKITATVSERMAAQIDGFSERQVEQAIGRMFQVTKVAVRPFDVPAEVWNAVQVQVDKVHLVGIDAE